MEINNWVNFWSKVESNFTIDECYSHSNKFSHLILNSSNSKAWQLLSIPVQNQEQKHEVTVSGSCARVFIVDFEDIFILCARKLLAPQISPYLNYLRASNGSLDHG